MIVSSAGWAYTIKNIQLIQQIPHLPILHPQSISLALHLVYALLTPAHLRSSGCAFTV
jgi:hypothetical protein